MNNHLTSEQIGLLLNRLEKHAANWANEGVYAESYVVGSNRWHQAKERSKKAEHSFNATLDEFRRRARVIEKAEDIQSPHGCGP